MPQADEIVAPPSKTSEGKAAEVEATIAETVAAMGYEVVRVLLSGARRPRLQVMAERRDGAAMKVEDCVRLSRAIEALLEVEDPIAGAYALEVSSPGLDRPLTRLKDFARFAGYEAKLETRLPIDGRRRWHGRLLGVEGDTVRLEAEGAAFEFRFQDLAKAKLVLTDALLASAPAAPESPEGSPGVSPQGSPGASPGSAKEHQM